MHSIFSRIFFQSDRHSQIIANGKRNVRLGCFSIRISLFLIIILKAVLMVLWIVRGNFPVNYECFAFGWGSAEFSSHQKNGGEQSLTTKNAVNLKENEILVLKRKDNDLTPPSLQHSAHNILRYSDRDAESYPTRGFVPFSILGSGRIEENHVYRRPSIKPTDAAEKSVGRNDGKYTYGEDGDLKRQKRFPQAPNIPEMQDALNVEEFVRPTSTSKPNVAKSKKIRILKIVRRPLHKNRQISSPKRYWRNVEQTEDPTYSSNKSAVGDGEVVTAKRRRVKTIVRIVPLKKLDIKDAGVEHGRESVPSVANESGQWSLQTAADVLQTKTTQNKIRRIKVIKRRRKLKTSIKPDKTQQGEKEQAEWEKGRPDKRYSGQDSPLTPTKNSTVVEVLANVKNEDRKANFYNADDVHNSFNLYKTRADEEENFPTVNVPYDEEETVKSASPSPQLHSTMAKISSTTSSSNVTAQIDAFKAYALCVTRAFFDAWCCVQFVAILLFALGIFCTSGEVKTQMKKCLIMPHLILDALFLVILLVYAVTIILFGCVLFVLINEMSLRNLAQWMLIAVVLIVLFILYMASFGVTLQCSEILLLSFSGVNSSASDHSGKNDENFIPRKNRHRLDTKTGDHLSQQHLLLNQVVDV